MKNIFKFMGLALVAGALMVACNPDPVEPEDTTPVNPDTPDVPTNVVTIKWDNVVQELGFKDAYQDSQTSNAYWLEAAKGMNGNSYVFPAFIAPVYYSEQNGMYPAFVFTFTLQGDTTSYQGNDIFPTEVYNEGGMDINGQTYGDYQLARYDLNNINLTFDPNTLTVDGRYTCTMFDYQAYMGGTQIMKDLEIIYDKFVFEAVK